MKEFSVGHEGVEKTMFWTVLGWHCKRSIALLKIEHIMTTVYHCPLGIIRKWIWKSNMTIIYLAPCSVRQPLQMACQIITSWSSPKHALHLWYNSDSWHWWKTTVVWAVYSMHSCLSQLLNVLLLWPWFVLQLHLCDSNCFQCWTHSISLANSLTKAFPHFP